MAFPTKREKEFKRRIEKAVMMLNEFMRHGVSQSISDHHSWVIPSIQEVMVVLTEKDVST